MVMAKMWRMKRQKRHPTAAKQRFLGTTTGRILILLCSGRQTVTDLARELGLTNNAVRAQLDRLQRDGLVQPAGARRGVRRPHAEYELAPEARELFPKAYEPVLRSLVDVMLERLPLEARERIVGETAHRILTKQFGHVRARGWRQRLDGMVKTLNGSSLGLLVAHEPGLSVVRSCSCPIASVTAAHPEVCGLFAGVLGEMLEANVRERCLRGESPQCHFEVRGVQ
jgi:predicted ArsR family transcriptional regulator